MLQVFQRYGSIARLVESGGHCLATPFRPTGEPSVLAFPSAGSQRALSALPL